MKCIFAGTARNCAPYIEHVLQNIELLAEPLDDYKIIIVYDHSDDNTLDILKKYQLKNDKLTLYINKQLISKYRTHRLAYGRNICLQYINTFPIEEYPIFIMMDFDDPNAKNVNVPVFHKYLNRLDWDCLSFQTSPKYYDIWGLSIYPYCFSYNHFKNSSFHDYYSIQDYIQHKLKHAGDKLVRCISSFNGFALYRRDKFMNCKYDGRPRFDLLPTHYLKAHKIAAKSPIVYTDLGHVKPLFEDCEHRAFHMEAINKNDAKIMITNHILFY